MENCSGLDPTSRAHVLSTSNENRFIENTHISFMTKPMGEGE